MSAANMQILSESEYINLSEKEKQNWVLYNPSMQDEAVGYLISLSNSAIGGLNQVMGLYENVKVLPSPTPAEQLDKFIKPFELAQQGLSPIEALESAPIIGALASPVLKQFKNIMQVIGASLQMVMLMQRNLQYYSDAIIAAYDSVDWDRLEEAKKQLTGGDKSTNTPSISRVMQDIDKVVFPTKKIEQDIKACAEQVNQCKAELEKLEGVKNTYKAIADSTRGLTYKAFISKLKAFTSLFGLDLAALQAEVDSVAFPDPQKTGGALGEKVNKILRNKQYIKKSDMEILKQKSLKQRKEA